MKKSLIALFAFLLLAPISLRSQSIQKALFDMEGLSFKAIKTPKGYVAAYELSIKQALDHNDPSKGYFRQKAYLSHAGFDQINVMVTNGYSAKRNGITEPAKLVHGNQISVEHRYFGKSVPDSIDYQYLNLEQATADYHHIHDLFEKIYTNKWISTGISKGGQTTIFYKYLFPEDVDVAMPYVAPINKSLEDDRIYTFLDTVNNAYCRNRIKEIQIRLFKEREKIIPLMRWYGYGAQLNFNYLSMEEALEYSILEYPFSFWQWGNDCDSLPKEGAAIEEILYHFVSVSGIDFFSDKGMNDYASHYYQAGSQMGYYGYDISDFKEYLKALPTDKNPSAVFMPNKMKVPFNNELILNCLDWLEKEGDQFIYINGNSDTWSATAVRPNKRRDALAFFMNGKDHGAARIRNMDDKDKEQLNKALERWLNIEIKD